MTPCEKMVNSIHTRFSDTVWEPFLTAVSRYSLIENGDKIAVCISGGKDSMLMAKLMSEYQKTGETDFELVYLVMDPGYNEENRKRIESNAKLLEVPITVFESHIFGVTDKTEKSPCYLCARMRRGHLYAKAKELGCNKIALGHHFSDVIETTLLGMFYGAQIQGMLPKLSSDNFSGMELIRPLYCIRETHIIEWKDYNNLHFIRCACRVTQKLGLGEDEGSSKRQEIKSLIAKLESEYSGVEDSIFSAVHNLDLSSVPEYKLCGVKHSFLESFEN